MRTTGHMKLIFYPICALFPLTRASIPSILLFPSVRILQASCHTSPRFLSCSSSSQSPGTCVCLTAHTERWPTLEQGPSRAICQQSQHTNKVQVLARVFYLTKHLEESFQANNLNNLSHFFFSYQLNEIA